MEKISWEFKKGIIQSNGKVLGDDGIIYTPNIIMDKTVLLIKSSWARVYISDVVNKRVGFMLNNKGYATDFGVLNKEETEFIKL